MRVYISGRITGLPEDEVVRKFTEAEAMLLCKGFTPVSPLNNGLTWENSWSEHMERDLEILRTCDAIFLLPDWEDSKGAKIEKGEAGKLGLLQMWVSPKNIVEDEIFRAIHEATGITEQDITGK